MNIIHIFFFCTYFVFLFYVLLVSPFAAVFMCQARDIGETTASINTSKVDPSRAFTLELCAGILDKAKPIAEIAVEEVLEECGYAVDVNALEKIVKAR